MVFIVDYRNILWLKGEESEMRNDNRWCDPFPADSQASDLLTPSTLGSLQSSGARDERVFGVAPTVSHGMYPQSVRQAMDTCSACIWCFEGFRGIVSSPSVWDCWTMRQRRAIWITSTIYCCPHSWFFVLQELWNCCHLLTPVENLLDSACLTLLVL